MASVRETRRAGKRPADHIGVRSRTGLAAVGSASWAAGGVAVFTNDNGVGAAALVAAGMLCLGLAAAGRWPSRITVSGNEMSWESIRETVDSQIEVAEEIGENASTIRELTVLRDRLDALERTGSVPEHPAVEYDRAVEAAIRRLIPGDATIHKAQTRSRSIADYELRDGDDRLLIETKWRQDGTAPYAGVTLPQLLSNLPPDAKLVVVTNATEEAAQPARELVEQHLGSRARVVSWRGVRDDTQLGKAIAALFLTA